MSSVTNNTNSNQIDHTQILPNGVAQHIASYCDYASLLNLASVNHFWKENSEVDSIWKKYSRGNGNIKTSPEKKLDILFPNKSLKIIKILTSPIPTEEGFQKLSQFLREKPAKSEIFISVQDSMIYFKTDCTQEEQDEIRSLQIPKKVQSPSKVTCFSMEVVYNPLLSNDFYRYFVKSSDSKIFGFITGLNMVVNTINNRLKVEQDLNLEYTYA